MTIEVSAFAELKHHFFQYTNFSAVHLERDKIPRLQNGRDFRGKRATFHHHADQLTIQKHRTICRGTLAD